ncbi:DUF2069 domain-containing protein [Thioalkalivibrio sp. XN8]|uniref:DUF2069 domain-containing protein n=1 Tax=Thioalkalivibrio sp. XN8 TaxID=2712863 RepID=UPI0013ECE710|nr:DUF2069 domain-containing protein [Thioalkalivibrio sp. XN8]NGP51905.1 DUF2069 domain-containing protein [Thioalkalivibrio sp. XN8]
MSGVAPARAVAIASLAVTGACLAGWLAPVAGDGGWPGVGLLLLLLLPLGLGVIGLARAQPRTAQRLSLLLPFYAAGFLVGAVGNPEARGWVTAGAFAVALAFGAAVSWVRRGAPDARPR